MAEIPLQSLGFRKMVLDLTRNAAAGDTMQTGKNKWLVYNNTSGAIRQLTVSIPGTAPTGQATLDLVESVAVGEMGMVPIGDGYSDPTLSNQAAINWDNVTGVKVAAVASL